MLKACLVKSLSVLLLLQVLLLKLHRLLYASHSQCQFYHVYQLG